MKLKIDEKDCLKKDLKIPKGYRLIEDYELLKESRTNKELKQLGLAGWIWANTENGIRAAGFDYIVGRFYVDGNYYFDDGSGHSRRVLVKTQNQSNKKVIK